MTNSIATISSAVTAEMTMSSLEIAALTGKEHKNVLADVRNMLNELEIQPAEFSAGYKDSKGETRPCFNLPYDLTMTLVSGYSIKLRHAIVVRWQELEDAQRLPAKPVKPIDEMSRKELMVFLTEMACDTQDMVHAMNGKLALGKFCTWTQYCKANSKLYAFRNPLKLCWLPPLIAARAEVDGWETFVMGNQDATSTLSPNSYPALLMHEFIKDSLVKRDKYAHLAAQVVPYEADLTLEIPAASRVLLERAKQAAVALRIIPND